VGERASWTLGKGGDKKGLGVVSGTKESTRTKSVDWNVSIQPGAEKPQRGPTRATGTCLVGQKRKRKKREDERRITSQTSRRKSKKPRIRCKNEAHGGQGQAKKQKGAEESVLTQEKGGVSRKGSSGEYGGKSLGKGVSSPTNEGGGNREPGVSHVKNRDLIRTRPGDARVWKHDLLTKEKACISGGCQNFARTDGWGGKMEGKKNRKSIAGTRGSMGGPTINVRPARKKEKVSRAKGVACLRKKTNRFFRMRAGGETKHRESGQGHQ